MLHLCRRAGSLASALQICRRTSMPLLTNLFGAFQKPESGENEYLMKAVMRVITFVGPQVGPIAHIIMLP